MLRLLVLLSYLCYVFPISIRFQRHFYTLNVFVCRAVIQIAIRLFQSYCHGLMPVFFNSGKTILRRAIVKRWKLIRKSLNTATIMLKLVFFVFSYLHEVVVIFSGTLFFGRCLINGTIAPPAYD